MLWLPQWLSGKESAFTAGDTGSIPVSGRSPGGGHGNPLSILTWRMPWTEELCRPRSRCYKESDTTEATKHSHIQGYVV